KKKGSWLEAETGSAAARLLDADGTVVEGLRLAKADFNAQDAGEVAQDARQHAVNQGLQQIGVGAGDLVDQGGAQQAVVQHRADVRVVHRLRGVGVEFRPDRQRLGGAALVVQHADGGLDAQAVQDDAPGAHSASRGSRAGTPGSMRRSRWRRAAGLPSRTVYW